MGWLTDLLKEIPASAVLKEKLETREAEYEQLKAERDGLRQELRATRDELESLKQQLQRSQAQGELDDNEKKLIALMAEVDPNRVVAPAIAGQLGLTPIRAQHHLDRLVQLGHVHAAHFVAPRPTQYGLTQQGRKYALDAGLSR